MKKSRYRFELNSKSACVLTLFMLISVWANESAAINVSEANVRFIGDEDGGSYFGSSVSSAGDFNGDGLPDIVIGQYQDNRAYIFFGRPADIESQSDLHASTADIEIWGDYPDSKRFGYSVSGAGDFNADGFEDVIIGDPSCTTNSGGGCAYLFFGGADFARDKILASEADRFFYGENANDNFGWSVAGAGLFNRDGYADIVIGAPKATDGGRDRAGRVYVFHGDDRSGPQFIYPKDDDLLYNTLPFVGDSRGFSVACAGDFDGDGWDDIVVGSHYGYLKKAIVFSYRGEIFHVKGSYVGFSVAGVGDINSDGFDDIGVGAPEAPGGLNSNHSSGGRAYIILGRPGGSDQHFLNVEAESHGGFFTLVSCWEGWALGYSMAGSGDFNNDGFSDVVVGAPMWIKGYFPPQTSQAFVFGGRDAALDAHLTVEACTLSWQFTSEGDGHHLGYSIGGLFDWNGDRFSDIIMGAPGNSGAYMFFGATTH